MPAKRGRCRAHRALQLVESALIVEIARQERLLAGIDRLVQGLVRPVRLAASCSPRFVSEAMVVSSCCIGAFRKGFFMPPV